MWVALVMRLPVMSVMVTELSSSEERFMNYSELLREGDELQKYSIQLF